MRKTWLIGLGIGLLGGLVSERDARATNVLEFPDNGSEQMGRGGAWVARASDPLAAFFNPAGLAGQRTALTLQGNISFMHTCFTRLKHTDDTSQEPLADPATGNFPRVCNDIQPFPNPQLGAALRVSDRVGLGLAVLGPSAVGTGSWPAFLDSATGPQAAPQRYLLIYGNLLQLNPTVSVGAEVLDNLRLGAAFHWGIFKAKFMNSAVALNADNQSPSSNDIAASLVVSDYFIPGFTLGGLYTIANTFDIAATYKWSDSIRASGDVYTQANYFTKKVATGDTSGIADGDSTLGNCNVNGAEGKCAPGLAKLEVAIPMEAKIGLRYHKPRARVYPEGTAPDVIEAAAERDKHLRDPLQTDVFDAELDLTWANNSAIDSLQIRFPGDEQGNGIIPVNGTPGTLPPNADVPKHYKDVFGVRAGGDVNLVPNTFALRAGVFYESKGQDVHYQNIDFQGGARFGAAGGLTYRLHMAKESALEFQAGFMHVFYATQYNDDPNGSGVNGITGTACNPTSNNQAGGTCTDGRQKYRTNWPVNLGTIANALNVINVGATYRF
jgi:long-subunit fatty acid transport protein